VAVFSQNHQVAITGGFTQSYKTRSNNLSPSENYSVAGWLVGMSYQLQFNPSLSMDLGANYVVDGGKMKYINRVSPDERIGVDETMQWLEIPISFDLRIRESRFRIGAILAYRYLIKSEIELDVYSTSGTFRSTHDFTNRRN